MQNLLAFRFSNGMFEPLWNKQHIDNIQFNVSETVGVEGRGGYYDTSGVLRDMIQNHMFQMLAYLCMEPPSSFKPDAIRNEKAKVLEAVRVIHAGGGGARTRCAASTAPPGRPTARRWPATARSRTSIPTSTTETFAALRLYIDNWRWEGVPIYLRSGKALWKRGTEIVVQFKKAPEVIFRDTPEVEQLEHNQLIFHIQPDQGIELQVPGQEPGTADGAAEGQHEVRLRRGVQGVALHRLRGDDLQLHDRRRDAVLAQRSGRGGVANRAADPRYWAASTPDRRSRTTRPAPGGRRRRSS